MKYTAGGSTIPFALAMKNPGCTEVCSTSLSDCVYVCFLLGSVPLVE